MFAVLGVTQGRVQMGDIHEVKEVPKQVENHIRRDIE